MGAIVKLLESVLGIFNKEKAKKVEFTDRLGVAEALGQAGDPRLTHDNWVTIGTLDIGKYPVSVAEHQVFVEDEGYANESWWKTGEFRKTREPGL